MLRVSLVRRPDETLLVVCQVHAGEPRDLGVAAYWDERTLDFSLRAALAEHLRRWARRLEVS